MADEPTRTQQDSMGEVQIPKDALYGAATQRAKENFPISGLVLPPEFISALAAIKSCCSEVNRDLKELNPEVADAIISAAEEVFQGNLNSQFIVDIFQTGSGTSTNMNMNEVLAHIASHKLGKPVHPNDDVNRCQSSNDVIPTAIHVAATVKIMGELLPSLQKLHDTLRKKSEEFSDVIKVGRTHLQDATPITLGQEFSGYASQMEHGIERIESALPHMFELPIGGTAVGTGINAHPEFGKRVCEKLKVRFNIPFREAPNHFEAQSNKDACVQTSATLKTVALSLTKIADDLRWMSSGPRAGLNEITLPALQPGSSIMPGKVNPVLCESVLQVAAQVIGNDAAITHAAHLSNFELNVGMPLIAYNLLQSITILARVCDVFEEKCIQGIKANREKLQMQSEENPMLITRLAPQIGYDRAAIIAKKMYEQKLDLRDIAKEEGLDEKTVDELLAPEKMV